MIGTLKFATAALFVAAISFIFSSPALAETCTTQSQMAPADRDALASAARGLAMKMQAGDAQGIRSVSIADLAREFAAISDVVGSTAPKLKGGAPIIDSVYLLDASTLKPGPDGNSPEAQFYCKLNRSVAEVNFFISGLPPDKYAFAIVEIRGVPAPWRLSFLLRQEQGKWLMAGLYPKALTFGGHDGLWYWTQARQMVALKESWNAWLYFRQAEALLLPAAFVQSAHFDKLQSEAASAAPPGFVDGVSPDTPLVVKAKDGTEYRFTSLGVDDSLGTPSVDIAVHINGTATGDQAAKRRHNIAAMQALLAAYPELRKPFHGIWVFADAPGQPSYATEQAMSDIP